MAPLDEAAFSTFYRQTSRALWAYVYRVTGHAADADDIVQEAFLRLLRAGPDAGDEDRRRYLYRVASNLVVDRWRAGKRQQDDERASRADDMAAGDLRASGPGDADVARTFAELTSRERALLWLAYVEEETHEDIAAALGVGRRSVKVLLFRARRRLRDLLKARGFS
ncbi:MAG: RNA polymerase sigma factor [Acidobacteria bacterium]|nr:RNA polymerase sigma factor [Acidobacteriota bacterium]